jgi:hypothetical protein
MYAGSSNDFFEVSKAEIGFFQTSPGLPESLFAYQKFQFEYILDGLAMEKVDINYGHSEYLKAIRHILLSFGIFLPHWYVFSRKIWQPWRPHSKKRFSNRPRVALSAGFFPPHPPSAFSPFI